MTEGGDQRSKITPDLALLRVLLGMLRSLLHHLGLCSSTVLQLLQRFFGFWKWELLFRLFKRFPK